MYAAISPLDNPILSELQRQVERGTGRHEETRLWIACSETDLDKPMRRVRDVLQDLVLRVPGDCLSGGDHDKASLLSGIGYALDNLCVREIVICGHSQCLATSQWDTEPQEDAWDFRNDSLLNGTLQRIHRNRDGRRLVLSQLEQLKTHPRIAGELAAGQLTLTAMFYLVESGLFTIYEGPTGRFRPIL